MIPKWFPNWSQNVCVIVASGPSARDVNLYRGIGKARFVAVNNSWRLAPWADFLFACDYKWWMGANGCREFKGWRVTTDRRAAETREWGLLRLVTRLADDRLQTDGSVGWGGNSGFQALNMVVNFGCKKIILVGFDMSIERGLHWHEPYVEAAENPTPSKAMRWQRCMDGAVKALDSLNVTAVNCSMESRLRKYPKMPFEDAMERFLA